MDELTRDEIDRFLDEQSVGRVACHAEGRTYVVPLIYARDGDALYVLTTEGLKIELMRKNPAVCFEIDEYDRGSGAWKSVIAEGRYEELGPHGVAEATSVLSRRFGARRSEDAGEGRAPRAEPGARPTIGFRVRIESVSGRAVRGRARG